MNEALVGIGVSIFGDCHIDSGMDAFKALALGADAISVGRAMLEPLQKKGVQGVEEKLRSMNNELLTMMVYTGFDSLDKINDSVVHFIK